VRSALFSLTITVVLAAGAAMFGYLAGRTLADAPGAYDRGLRDGAKQARVALRAEHAREADALAHDVQQRLRADAARARRRGVAAGVRRGEERARRALLASFPDWQPGRWYLVRAAGDTGFGASVPVAAGRTYGLCDEPPGLCSRRLTRAATR
jgi:hypothetical protein